MSHIEHVHAFEYMVPFMNTYNSSHLLLMMLLNRLNKWLFFLLLLLLVAHKRLTLKVKWLLLKHPRWSFSM